MCGGTCKKCTDIFFVQYPLSLLQVSFTVDNDLLQRAFLAYVNDRRDGKHAARHHNQNCFVVLICTDVCLLLARAMRKSPITQAMTAMQLQQVNQDILRGRGPK